MSFTTSAAWCSCVPDANRAIENVLEAEARHPQDGPHVDLRFRLENTEFLAEISMNLVFLDWMIQSSREDDERIDASELVLLQPRLLQTLSQQMPVSIDGVRVDPVLRALTVNDPDQALLPLFPLSGWRGLRKISFTVAYSVKAPPQQISVVWSSYPPDLLSVLAAKPPLEIAAEWSADGLRSQLLFTRSEPEFTWHRVEGGIAARLEEIPAPSAAEPLLPGWMTITLAAFAVGSLASIATRTPVRRAFVRGLVASSAALIVVGAIGPHGVERFSLGTRAATPLDELDAAQTFESLHTNLYRAFDYDAESSVYDALSHSVSGALLTETYLSVRRALVVEEEGGAMSRVESVQPLSTRIVSQGEMEIDGAPARAFVVEASWRVNGRVTHWGHAHDRLTEYDGRFVVAARAEGWRIHDAQITRQERVEDNATTPSIDRPPIVAPEDEEL